MKTLMILGTVVGGIAVLGMAETAKAGHRSCGPSYSTRSYGGSFGHYAPRSLFNSSSYGYRSYGGHGYSGYSRGGSSFGYYSPRFSISFGSGSRGFSSYGRGYSRHGSHRHHHH